ncbi:DUF6941 family protein [Verrucomicrobiota bacterium]
MIPDLQSSLVCDDVRQETNGKFMLIGLFDAVQAPSFPLTVPKLCLVNRWCSGEGEFTQQVRILNPDQKVQLVSGRPLPVKLSSAEVTAINVEVFINVTFQEIGTYWVEVLLDGDLKIRYPLRVRELGEAPE